MKYRIFTAALSIYLFAHTALAQQVYKWVDESGKMHFSDKPFNKDAEAITIKQQPRLGGTGTSSTAPKTRKPHSMDKTLDAYSDRRRLKQQQQAKQEAEAAKQQQLQHKCESSRNYLAHTEGKRLYDVNDKGERVYLNDAEIDAERAKLQSEINKYCR